MEAAKERVLAEIVSRSTPPPSPRQASLPSSPLHSAPALSPPLSPPPRGSTPLSSPPLSPSYSIIPPVLPPPPVYWDTLTNKPFRDYLKLLALEGARGREQRDFESTAEEDEGPCRLETMSESDLEESADNPRMDIVEEDGFVLLRC